jgi:hypothetical protein
LLSRRFQQETVEGEMELLLEEQEEQQEHEEEEEEEVQEELQLPPTTIQHPTISINPTTTIQLPPRTFLNNLKQPSTIQQQFNCLQPSSTTSNNLQLPSLLSRRFQQEAVEGEEE